MATEAYYRKQRELTRSALMFVNRMAGQDALFDRVQAFANAPDDARTLRWSTGIFRRLKNEGVIEMLGTRWRPKYKSLRKVSISDDTISDYASTTYAGEQAYNRRIQSMPFDGGEMGADEEDDREAPQISDLIDHEQAEEAAQILGRSLLKWAAKSHVNQTTVDEAFEALRERTLFSKLSNVETGLMHLVNAGYAAESQDDDKPIGFTFNFAFPGPFNVQMLRQEPEDDADWVPEEVEQAMSAIAQVPATPPAAAVSNGVNHAAAPTEAPSDKSEPSMEEMISGIFEIFTRLVPAVNRIERRLIDMDAKLTRIYGDLTGATDGK